MDLAGAMFGASGLNVLGTYMTNESNEDIASARNEFEAAQAVLQRDWSAEQAQINRDFEERMSNTAVTRRMEDMRNAGINPLLAGKFDASSPAGSMPSGASAHAYGYEYKNPFEGAISSALQVMQLKQLDAQIDNIKAQTDLTRNKEGISEPVETLMRTIQDVVDDYRNSASSGDKSSSVWQKLKTDITEGGAARRAANAKKIEEIKKSTSSWIDGLKSDLYKFKDSAVNWWESLKRDARVRRGVKP